MKKILLLVLGFIIIICMLSIDSNKVLSFFDQDKQEILAKVNGEKITYLDVESLYDIRYAHTSISPPSIVQLQLEYAELLYKRIEQILITQELNKRGLTISDQSVDAFEAIVRKDYEDTEEYQDISFSKIIEDSGVSYPVWKSQLKIRLEIEVLQKDIARNIVVDSEKILEYVKLHPELATTPDKLDFIVIKSSDKAKLEKIKKANTYNYNKPDTPGTKVERALFDLPNVPKEYLEDLKKMKPRSFSEIKSNGGKGFYVLYLNVYEKNQSPDALRLYSIAEKKLLELETPAAYDQWLMNTLKYAEITVAEEFLPRNLPSEDLSKGVYSILQDSTGLPQGNSIFNADDLEEPIK